MKEIGVAEISRGDDDGNDGGGDGSGDGGGDSTSLFVVARLHCLVTGLWLSLYR